MANTAVKPPSAAARVPVRTVSLLVAGLAQVGVQVDEAGQRDQAVGVDHGGAGGGRVGCRLGAHLDDAPVGEQQVGGLCAQRLRAADQVGVGGVLIGDSRF